MFKGPHSGTGTRREAPRRALLTACRPVQAKIGPSGLYLSISSPRSWASLGGFSACGVRKLGRRSKPSDLQLD
jgi:hypothetical protein